MLQSSQDRPDLLRGSPIYITHLSLVNFRNYESLELDLGPGMVLVQGANGQGKSNLLEAIYILAIAKSPRASTDREVIRWQAAQEETYTRIAASIHRDGRPLRVQIDFRSQLAAPTGEEDEPHSGPARRYSPEGLSVQKYIRVNGVPRRASELVGEVNAVMFSAQDLELVHGPPPVRRRYLDILISQLDHPYLRSLQRYQRVVNQRNHLLKLIREGRAQAGELDFWDAELVREGRYIMSLRLRTINALSQLAGPFHSELTGNGERLEMLYRPSVALGPEESEEALGQALREALEQRRPRELAQGVTLAGPHRDDLQLLLDSMDAGAYASRGQSRTIALAMKLGEARYLTEQRRQEPVLLLDDVLSELDATRRAHILETAGRYQQSIITTAEVELIGERFLGRMARFQVHRGLVVPVEAPSRADAPPNKR